MMELLKHIELIFDDAAHTYTRPENGKSLIPVTYAIRRQIFQDMYANIPQHILDAAAEWGNMVHRDIEKYDKSGTNDLTDAQPWVQAYADLKSKHLAIDNEYRVANDTHAGSIDCVWMSEEGEMILADVKATSKLHLEYVKWQTSVYAYLFEHCNPNRKITKLFVVWIPKEQYGKPRLEELERIPSETIEALLKADAAGEQFVLPTEYAPAVVEEPLPTEYAEAEAKLVAALQFIEEQKKAMKESENIVTQLKEQLLTAMEAHGIKKWQTDRLTITYKAGYTSPTVDTAKLKKDKLYDKYIKHSQVKSSIQIKLC